MNADKEKNEAKQYVFKKQPILVPHKTISTFKMHFSSILTVAVFHNQITIS